jgi:hypothetical protein
MDAVPSRHAAGSHLHGLAIALAAHSTRNLYLQHALEMFQ